MNSVFDRRHFLKEDKELLNRFLSLSSSVDYAIDNVPYILLRTNTLSLSGNVDTFVFSTSANPTDTIEYTSDNDIVNISIRDGGFF